MSTRSSFGYMLAALLMVASMFLSAGAAQAAPEDRLPHQNEVAVTADIFVDDDFTSDTPGWGVTHFNNIQLGIDAAQTGNTIDVAAGVYTEQVVITKEITLHGAGLESVINAYPNMPVCFVTASGDNRPVVCVKDNVIVTIDGFLIDGLGLGAVNHRLNGVGFHNAGGTIQNLTIQGIRDDPFNGAQRGVGIYVYNDDTTPYTVNVYDNTILDFQKNAMALNAADNTPLNVDVERNIVVGHGATNITAQNGIQVWAMMGTGKVVDNEISGIGYDNSASVIPWVGTSILNFYATLEVSGNTIVDAQEGIYFIDASGIINGNDLLIKKAGLTGNGINASDPPAAIPSPAEPLVKSINQSVMNVLPPASVEIYDNNLTIPIGYDYWETVGFQADAGYDQKDLIINFHDNKVSGFYKGLVFNQCNPLQEKPDTCTASVFKGITVFQNNLDENITSYTQSGSAFTIVPEIHFNRIFKIFDGIGISNLSVSPANAENNWWGCNDGPFLMGSNNGCTVLDDMLLQVDTDPWLTLTLPASVDLFIGETMDVIAEGTHNSDFMDVSSFGILPDGIYASFSSILGQVDPIEVFTTSGFLNTTYHAPLNEGEDYICTWIDGEVPCMRVNVHPNDVPLAESMTVQTNEDVPLNIKLAATDTYPGTLAWTVDNPQHGTLSGTAPEMIYTPDQDWNGEDSFTFTVSDGMAASNTATVTIAVAPINDIPVAPSITTVEWLAREAHTLAIPTFTDIDGDILTYSASLSDGNPLPAWLHFDPLALTFSGTPVNSVVGNFVIKVTASDGTAEVSTTFTITVVYNPFIYFLPIVGK